MTASASAICGTRLGFTKLTVSTRRRPARTARPISSTLSPVPSMVGSDCRPSRGETSTICTAGSGVFGWLVTSTVWQASGSVRTRMETAFR